MNQTKKHYHHGDLRQTLLDTATAIISEGGVDALSMRKLADHVGVSRTAPYHHFKDKNALLCAIAEAGFKQHFEVVSLLPQQHPQLDKHALFELYVLSYIRFADSNPETYDLMFGKEIWKLGQPSEALHATSRQCFQHWLEWIEVLQTEKVLTDQHPTLRVAQASWATLHGLCRLLNDGIYVNRDDLEEMGKTAAAMLLKSPAGAD
ncbi:TetR/AcrR family transcriptional regulator [Marinobacterium jannaschii]|uniref:TetR/AcrR family transcriptional regulator n=1 Tax=Marinobacterium jannaschii TaxID=64970 RepID=UPI000484316E|nr:TetR/AcrR family transcriptional regulator [Marinobacterium jannaschii]